MATSRPSVIVRKTRASDFDKIIDLCDVVYPRAVSWNREQLASHLNVFPDGQLVAEDTASGEVVGMAASLIVRWDDYDIGTNWRDFTDHGMFTNHDPENGRTLYGAEVMVHPRRQGGGIGKKLYAARRDIVRRQRLPRIRAGARLRGYGRYAERLSPEEYTMGVVRGELADPTLTFQIKQGFRVLSLVEAYLRSDPESRGYAAVIEWLNPELATAEDRGKGDPRFAPPRSED